MSQAKYIVGIDLGTTKVVMTAAKIPIEESDQPSIDLFPILQEFAKETTEDRETLPSFLFDRVQEKPVLPWKREQPFIVGEYARERGAEVPARLVSSAKSWLCNPRVNRRDPILPWNAPEGSRKVSPLDAQAELLQHVRACWNQKYKSHKLEDQMVVITIPASFDAVARDLTLEAAKKAGLEEVVLLEEPQAAFYAWIRQSQAPWREQVKRNDVVLVVDVGGGTTDFSLIEIGEEGGDLNLSRVAVGNHILLGGDNMDLTLAFHVKSKLEAAKKKIDTWQTIALSHSCRKAKERMLADPTIKSEPIVVSGRGSSVIGGTMKTTLEREEIENLLVEGFFPPCVMADEPQELSESGFREVNLAYASDPGVTRHLAKFLNSQSGNKEYQYPNAVLFNGGVFKSDRCRERLVEVINAWLKQAGKEPVRVLTGDDLVRAVASGASAFGLARQGRGIRIRGGVSQAYYLGIETTLPAVPGIKPPLKTLCVAAIGMEEGSKAQIPERTFGLVVGRPVQFKFYRSPSRRDDKIGQLAEDILESLEETSGLSLNLPAAEGMTPGSVVDVTLEVGITEIGTLEIWCLQKSGEHKWKLEFNVRDAIK